MVKKLINVIINIIFIIIFLLGLFVFLISYNSKDGVLHLNNYSFASISEANGSIEKYVKDGDLIFIKNLTFDEDDSSKDLVINETLVAYYYDVDGDSINEILVNTYVGKIYFGFQYMYEFQNDSTEDQNHIVSKANIIGIYQKSIRNVGTIINYLKSGWGYFLTIIIPMFIYVVYMGIKLFTTYKDYSKEKKVEYNKISEAERKLEREKIREELMKELQEQLHQEKGANKNE